MLLESQDPNRSFGHTLYPMRTMMVQRSDLPDMFLLAPFRKDHAITTGDQRESLNTIFRKLDLTKTHAQDVEWWEQNFQSQVALNDP